MSILARIRSISVCAVLVICAYFPVAGAFAEPVSSNKVYIFTIDFCPICLTAKSYFKEHKIPFTEFNIDHNARAKEVFEENDGRGIPLIIVNGKRLYGFDSAAFDAAYRNNINRS